MAVYKVRFWVGTMHGRRPEEAGTRVSKRDALDTRHRRLIFNKTKTVAKTKGYLL